MSEVSGYGTDGQAYYRGDSHGGNGSTQNGNVPRETIGAISFSPCGSALQTIVDRQDDYGDPDPIYAAVGRKWGAHLSLLFGVELPDIPAKHVYIMLADMKGTREASKEKADNLTDKAGYTELAARARR